MTARTWTGTVNNDASIAGNWSPSDSAPNPGDTLTDTLNGSTIDITGKALVGSPLTVGSETIAPISATLNLNHAQVNLTETTAPNKAGGTNVIANMSGNVDTLDATLISTPHRAADGVSPSTLTVNLADHTELFGHFDVAVLSSVTIIGQEHAQFINNATDSLNGGRMVINTDVRGSGTFKLFAKNANGPGSVYGSRLEFGGFVSGGQTVDLTGNGILGRTQGTSSVIIDRPNDFHGTVTLHDFSMADLVGLAQADSWSYNNDLLSIKASGGQVIDTLHVISDAASTGSVHGLTVSKSAAGDMLVSPGTDFSGSFIVPTT